MAQREPRTEAGPSEAPVLTVALSSVQRGYGDVKVVFDLAHDAKGFQTFKETVNVFLTGVAADKPCELRIFATRDGLQTVGVLPVGSDAEFKKFLRNLWDVDVKTAPPPEPALMPQVPAAVRSKLQNQKLQPNERLIFGLSEGFVRHESEHVHLAESLEAVRRPAGTKGVVASTEATVSLHIDGQSATPDQRHKAFDKARERTLSQLKKNEHESDAGFALRKALVDYQFAKMRLVFSETSHGDFRWTTSHEKKQSEWNAEITPAGGTSLANDLARVGQSPDEFTGVSKQNAVFAGSINLPVNRELGKSLKTVVQQGRVVAKTRIDRAQDLDASQKSIDSDFAALVFDVIDDVADMSSFNGFVRTWSNGDGTLTTVGATQVGDGQKYQERVQKFPARESVGRKGNSENRVEVHKIALRQWRQEYPELFDSEGTVLIGTSKNAVWYAVGAKALERLDQAIQEAEGRSESKSEMAIDLYAEMGPLAEVCAQLHSRKPEGTARRIAEKSKRDEKPSVARAASIVADLNLPKIAAEAYQDGKDSVSFTLKRAGDKATLSARFDEGTLRFIGKALSKFVKDNLED